MPRRPAATGWPRPGCPRSRRRPAAACGLPLATPGSATVRSVRDPGQVVAVSRAPSRTAEHRLGYLRWLDRQPSEQPAQDGRGTVSDVASCGSVRRVEARPPVPFESASGSTSSEAAAQLQQSPGAICRRGRLQDSTARSRAVCAAGLGERDRRGRLTPHDDARSRARPAGVPGCSARAGQAAAGPGRAGRSAGRR